MLQVQHLDSSHLNESQIYEDLSQIIKSFKNLLSSLDNIANNLLKFESTSHLFEELKQTLNNLNGFAKIYSYPIDNDSEHKNTFHRFICRLLESISAYKAKLQNLPYFTTLSSEVRQIENIIMSYQQEKNIGLIIKKIQNVVNRFCSKTIKSLEVNNKSAQNGQNFVHSDKNSEFTTMTQEYSNPDEHNVKFSFAINQTKPKKVVESKSENSLNKVMTLLNRKYRTLACLDIQYQEFKHLFFRSRDSRSELYDDCFERNSFIYKEILRYSKQFSEYLEKRQLKIFRKNKFIDSLGQNNIKIKSKVFSGKNQDSPQVNFNFTKKKVVNTDVRKMTENVIQDIAQSTSELSSPYLMARSQLVDQKFSNLVSIQNPKSGHMTPQLIEQKKKPNIFPLMINGNQHLQERQKFDEINGETFLQLSKRKKNLQLKKIDISLTSFGSGPNNQIQSAKLRNKLMNGEAFKKVSVNNSKQTKQMEEKINNSIRKNYLQKKYEQAMKKNTNSSILEFEDESHLQLPSPSKNSSSKFLEFQQQTPQNQPNRQRKYLIKTSNKRPTIQGGTQYKSLNTANQRREISTIKNFRTLKMDQSQRIEKLQKMKETVMNHIEFLSGGRAIRPALQYRQKEHITNTYTEGNQEEFSDVNLGSFKQLESEGKQQRFL